MQFEIIINPHAGSGKGSQVWQSIRHVLDHQHISYHHHLSHQPGAPRELALSVGQTSHPRDTCVLVIGGDGTLHEVVTGLLQAHQEKPLPISYIPAGTGNDFARGYGISTDPLTALQQILGNRQLRWINVGRFQNGPTQRGIFLNNFGIGFDASIVHATNHSKMKNFLNHHHLGSLAYISKAIGVLIHQPAFDVTITTSSQTHHFRDAFLVVTSNHPYIGGGIKVAPDEAIDRQELELVVLEKHGNLSLLRSVVQFALGRVANARDAHLFRARELDYQISPAQHGQIDGEELGQQSFRLHLSCTEYPIWEQPLA